MGSIECRPGFRNYPKEWPHYEEGSWSGKEIGKGGEDIGKGAAKGSADLAKGAAGGVGNLATGHPVGAVASTGKGVGEFGENVGVGTSKGVVKIGKGVGGEFKKLGHNSEKKGEKSQWRCVVSQTCSLPTFLCVVHQESKAPRRRIIRLRAKGLSEVCACWPSRTPTKL